MVCKQEVHLGLSVILRPLEWCVFCFRVWFVVSLFCLYSVCTLGAFSIYIYIYIYIKPPTKRESNLGTLWAYREQQRAIKQHKKIKQPYAQPRFSMKSKKAPLWTLPLLETKELEIWGKYLSQTRTSSLSPQQFFSAALSTNIKNR